MAKANVKRAANAFILCHCIIIRTYCQLFVMYHNLRNTQEAYNMDMAYTMNPNMPKVRRDAVNLVKYRGWSMHKVSLRFGVNVGTISRWCRRGTGWNLIETK